MSVCVRACWSGTSARESTMKAPLQRRRFAYCHRKSNALQLTYKMAHLIPPYFLYRGRAVLVCTSLFLSALPLYIKMQTLKQGLCVSKHTYIDNNFCNSF